MSINFDFETEFKEACQKGDTQRMMSILQPKKFLNDFFKGNVSNKLLNSFLFIFENFRGLH